MLKTEQYSVLAKGNVKVEGIEAMQETTLCLVYLTKKEAKIVADVLARAKWQVKAFSEIRRELAL